MSQESNIKVVAAPSDSELSAIDEAVAKEWRPSDSSNPQKNDTQSHVDPFKRIYHNVEDSPYVLPSDITEGQRLNAQHHLVQVAFGTNFLAKAIKPQLEWGIKVLDVGTGTGYWAFEMHREFPNSEYYGVDIAINEWTKATDKHENVHFSIGNVLERLPYEDNFFDYVHQRFLFSGIPNGKWPILVEELKRVTKPGGWIELVEADGKMRDAGPSLTLLSDVGEKAMIARGVDFSVAREPTSLLKQANLKNVEGDYVSIPVGWGGEVGVASLKDYLNGFLNVKAFLAPVMKLSVEEYEQRVQKAYEEAQTTAYANIYWGIGQLEG